MDASTISVCMDVSALLGVISYRGGVQWEQGSSPKGPMSCRTQGWISRRPERANLRAFGCLELGPERFDFGPERDDFGTKRVDFGSERVDSVPYWADFGPES